MTTFDTPPDHVNEAGVKWWLDKPTTGYAQAEDMRGTKLPGYTVWFVEETNGTRSRVLISDEGEIVYSTQACDALGARIDLIKVARRFKDTMACVHSDNVRKPMA